MCPYTIVDAEAVVKSDVTVFTNIPHGVYVGVTGDVALRLKNGSSHTFKGVQAGTILWAPCDMVLSTGTSATDMLLIYI